MIITAETVLKTDAVFFSLTSLTQSYFHFHPILHRPHAKTPFSEWTVEYFLFNLLQIFAIEIDIEIDIIICIS